MATIKLADQYIEIVANSTDPDFLHLLSSLSGVFKERRQNTFRCSVHKLPEVLRAMRNVQDSSGLVGVAKEVYDKEMLRRERTRLLKELGPDMTSDWLWPNQCLGIELAQINDRYNFFYDTRTGKTLMSLKIMYDRLRSGENRRCLVICPPNIIKAWQNDAAEHFPELKLSFFYGDTAQRYEALQTPAHIVVWSTTQLTNNIELLKQCKFDTCFFDESSKLKNYRSQISESALELAKHIKSWYNLSATPAPNCESEYYTQMRIIDPYIFNPFRTHFVSRYFDNTSRDKNYEKLKIKEDKYEEFMSIIEDYSIYVDQKSLPTAGKEWHNVYFELPQEVKDIYDEMRVQKSAEIKGVSIEPSIAAAIRAKLNQIASEFVLDTEAIKSNKIARMLKLNENKAETIAIGTSSRVEALDKLLKQLGEQKVVIWANYKEEFAMIRELLKDDARYINGETSVADKEQYIYSDFKKGPLRYLVCHPASVGMGINLTEAHVAIYYSLNDSWEALKQSSERIYGHIAVQPHKCHYYMLMARGTINEVIYDNVTNKRDLSTGLLLHLQGRFNSDR